MRIIEVVGLLSLGLTGCAANQATEPVRLVPKARSLIADVPQPIGFEIVERVSEDAMTGARRLYLRHLYEGHTDAYSVRNFYLEHMPHYRWRKAWERSAKGVHTLRFEKGLESCNIRIAAAGSGWSNALHVEVLILQEDRPKQKLRPRQSS